MPCSGQQQNQEIEEESTWVLSLIYSLQWLMSVSFLSLLYCLIVECKGASFITSIKITVFTPISW